MIHKRLLSIIAAVLPMMLFAAPNYNPADPNPPVFPYDMSYPYAYFDLDEALNNISGLSNSNDPKTLAGIKDDEGKIFFIDKKSGKVVKDAFFATEGEFGGIEIVGQDAYAVKQSGQLYKVSNLNGASRTVKMLRTGLARTDIVEGLAYDLAYNRLLLAAKGMKEGEFSRKVYAFDLKTNTCDANPVFEITLASFKEFLTNRSEKQYLKLREEFIDKPNSKGFDFMPTSIAVHPITNNIHIVSAENNMMLIVNANGEIQDMVKFKKEQHYKVEGICFDADGTMYLSNEAKDGKPAKLYAYKMQSGGAVTARR
jgi:uncharacterized protein YjiK